MKYFLGFVFFLFIGLLVFVYWGSKQANPVLLDQHGKPYAEAGK
ncbi:MAG: hypothetical protein SFV51_07050 [Bryobacteraceae bacterium]|nr:hypothetical protein [Bryobacteraceae bacterium]